MGRILTPAPVKLIVSLFTNNPELLNNTENTLIRKFGPIDFASDVIDFNQTAYYEKEFGPALKRKFISFQRLISSSSLWKIKIVTNRLERKFSHNGNRRINIDPGYLSQANVVLASTKMFFHRIHINKGIHQEVTLIYQDKTFKPLPWTYPDYQTEQAKKIFLHIRTLYAAQLKH